MKIKKTIIALGLSASVLMLPLSPAAASDMAEMIEENCSTCHSMKYTCVKLGKKTEAGWKLTFKRMNSKGASFPASKVDEAAVYLMGLNKGDGPFCD